MLNTQNIVICLSATNLDVCLITLASGALLINLLNFRSPDIPYHNRPKTWLDFITCYWLCLLFLPLLMCPARYNHRRIGIVAIASITTITVTFLLWSSHYPLLVICWLAIVMAQVIKGYSLRQNGRVKQ